VAEAFHEFDESFDDDEPGRLLPPDDRIWRHPSEMSSQPSGPIPAEVSAARERWMSRTPTRAGAWSAGIVGAMLATGVVLVGTHLTVWLGRGPAEPSGVNTMATTTVVQHEVTTVVSPAIARMAVAVHSGLTVVQVSKSNGSVRGNGVVLTADGKILVPLPLINGATAIAVTTSDGAVYAGRLVGTDAATQLAVISIGITSSAAFTPLTSATDTPVRSGDWLAVEWSQMNGNYEDKSVLSIGSVSTSVPAAAEGAYDLLETLGLEVPHVTSAPLGTVLVNSSAQVLGIVTSHQGNDVVEIPGLLAEHVGQQIVAHGRVLHGWLGIEGQYTPGSVPETQLGDGPKMARRGVTSPAGVEIVAVGTGTSAAEAGLRPGDVIEAVNGQQLGSMQALQEALYVLPPLTAVALTVDRGASISTVDAYLQPAA
jgi:S1-C subfamily serine protease